MLEEEGPQQPLVEGDLVHLVNRKLGWELRETANGMLTDGKVSEALQHDRIHQIVQ